MNTAVATLVEGPGGSVALWAWCPGCHSLHSFAIRAARPGAPVWSFDGDLGAPTLDPALVVPDSVHLCEGEHPPEPCLDRDCRGTAHLVLHDPATGDPGDRVLGHPTPHTRRDPYGPCRSLLRGGVWEFLPGTAHRLEGSRHPMVPLPRFLAAPASEA